MLRSLGLLAISAGWAAGQSQCYTNDRPINPDKMENVFCPAEQFGGGNYVQFGSCCLDSEENVIEAKFLEAGSLTTACADLYKQVLCGQCHSFSGHVFARLGENFGPWDGMSMKREFCEAFVDACGDEINLGGAVEYHGLNYCDHHVGDGISDDDEFWSFPYTDDTMENAAEHTVSKELSHQEFSTLASKEATETCTNGVVGIDGEHSRGSVCCPLDCGQCGGDRCGRGGRYRECCINGILRHQSDCSDSATAPCVVSRPSETCTNGIVGIDGENSDGSVCCPLDCGQCGGDRCGRGGRNGECCIHRVLKKQPDCSDSATAPCVVSRSPPPTPAPVTPAPVTPAPITPAPIEGPGYEYIGCFQEGSPRMLNDKWTFTNTMDAEECKEFCTGFDYFSTQFSKECYCGSGDPDDTYNLYGQVPDSDCNMACAGDVSEMCGGSLRGSVYSITSSGAPQ